MLDPIVNFFTWIFQWIGRGIGFVIGIILWPFMWAARWYGQRGWMLKGIVGAIIAGLVVFYGYFIWQTQHWNNFNPDYPNARHAREGQFTGRRTGRGPRDGRDCRRRRATRFQQGGCYRLELYGDGAGSRSAGARDNVPRLGDRRRIRRSGRL